MKEIFESSEVGSVFKKLTEYLKSYKILSPETESEILISEVTGLPKIKIYLDGDYVLSDNQKDLLNLYIKRRLAGEPLEYILGFKEFFGIRFKVNPDVLIPRFETELLVEEILKNLNSQFLNILDIGTGCGNIAISLKKIKDSLNITASDISRSALEVAKENSNNILGFNAINFVQSDLFENIKGTFDIIVSNPPYIPESQLETLPKEVKDFEPKIALDGGEDGLYFYRRILKESKDFLNKGGYVFLELNPLLVKDILKIASKNKFKEIKIVNDYNNLPRILYCHL